MQKVDNYFSSIEKSLDLAYKTAQKAKAKGFDPNNFVEIPIGKDISDRVEGLVGVIAPQILNCLVPKRIVELEELYGKLDIRVALVIAIEVAKEKFCKFKNKKEAMETGIRVGFSYITLGVISAPLEGFIDLEVKERSDGKKYLCMNFAGPIRAAGGTAGALSVLICDYVRKNMGFDSYDVKDEEVKRFCTEVSDYNNRCTKLQYVPSDEEIEFFVKNMKIEISGTPTEKLEVSNYKDLKRVKGNKIRGGMCLVLAECLIQKAPKLLKRVESLGKDFDLSEWLFLKDFLELQKKIKAKDISKDNDNKNKYASSKEKVLPSYKFIEDVVGGRPVFTFPMAKGGFRLRYGRNRTSGFASTSISSETLEILDKFVAVGTQLRLERPGKSTVVTPCDYLEPPIVKLRNGSVIRLNTKEKAKKYSKDIVEILHLGDLLISYAEFKENNHVLVPNGYCEEEWALELKEKRDEGGKMSEEKK